MIDNFEAFYNYLANDDKTYYIITNYKATKNKIISIDFNNADQSNWKTIIEETEDVLDTGRVVDTDKLLLIYNHHVCDYIKLYNLYD